MTVDYDVRNSLTDVHRQAGGDARACAANGRSVLHCACVGHSAGERIEPGNVLQLSCDLWDADCVAMVIKAGAHVNLQVGYRTCRRCSLPRCNSAAPGESVLGLDTAARVDGFRCDKPHMKLDALCTFLRVTQGCCAVQVAMLPAVLLCWTAGQTARYETQKATRACF